MGRMKRLLAAMLAVLMLTGCSNANLSPGAAVTVPSQTEPELYPAGRSDIKCELLPESVDAPADVPVLKWICLGATSTVDYMVNQTFSYYDDWSEEAAEELNRALAEMGEPYRIQFVMFSTTASNDIDWFRVPEVLEAMESADLITGTFTQSRMQTWLLPLTQYVEKTAEPSLASSVAHPVNWVDATVDGMIYGVPTVPRYAVGSGWNVREEGLTQLKTGIDEFQKEYWEMDEVFHRLYEKNSYEPFMLKLESGITTQKINGVAALLPSAVSTMLDNRFDVIGSCFAVDYSGEKPMIVNYLRTDYVRDIQQAMLRYDQAGYYMSGTGEMQLLDYSNCFSDATYTYTWGKYDFAQEIICTPVTQLHYAQTSTPLLTGILQKSANARTALKLLSEMGEDKELRDRILLGTEGKDYTLKNGEYQPLEREDGSYAMTFLSPLDNFDVSLDDHADMLYPVKEGMDRLSSYRQVMDDVQVWQTISFDYTTLAQEELAVRQVLEKYLPEFATMTSERYEQMLLEISQAGEEYIQSELQRQLDDWYKNQ